MNARLIDMCGEGLCLKTARFAMRAPELHAQVLRLCPDCRDKAEAMAKKNRVTVTFEPIDAPESAARLLAPRRGAR